MAEVSPTAEQAALAMPTANWKAVIEDNVFTAAEQADRRRDHRRTFT